jgi:hypothetical protein
MMNESPPLVTSSGGVIEVAYEDWAYRSNRQQVEDLSAVLPSVGVTVFLLALIVKAVNLSDLPGFVVSSEESNLVRPSGLERQEIGECLQAVVATVDEITLEGEEERIRNGLVREVGRVRS